MHKEELISRLARYEWNDFECKKSQHGVSEDVYESVSAFANTEGGWLVFGVEDNHGELTIVGVIDIDKVQNDFLTALRSGTKVSPFVGAKNEEKIEHNGDTLLIFYIPESPRSEKPVHLNNDIRQCYIRRGSCDEKCNLEEIKRFLRDASSLRLDNELVPDIRPDDFFDVDSLLWYRNIIHQKEPGRYDIKSDFEFLKDFGFIVEKDEKFSPTRAGIILFGKERFVRQILNRPIVDFQRIDFNFKDWTPEKRWHDRIVVEENLINAWHKIVQKYSTIADRPFSVDTSTLRRHDEPPYYIAFREAAINLLIHQDFGDSGRLPSIVVFKDRIIFWNPGDAFATDIELLEPREKEVRNPAIVGAFRRIGLSDQAGTGVSAIFGNWRTEGNIPPIITNDKSAKSFKLVLIKEILLTEEQFLFQASLGVRLNEDQASTFAFICRNRRMSLLDIRALTGKSFQESRSIIQSLINQVLVKQLDDTNYELIEHLKEHPFVKELEQKEGIIIKESPPHPALNSQTKALDPIRKLDDLDFKILSLCEVPCPMRELLQETGYQTRMHFRNRYIVPLLERGLIEMTVPDKPNSSNQKYVVTQAGMQILLLRRSTSPSS